MGFDLVDQHKVKISWNGWRRWSGAVGIADPPMKKKRKKEKRAEGGVRARAADRQKGTLEVGSKRSERWAEIRAGILRTYIVRPSRKLGWID